jgi:uncharacterized protein with HEPN domain
VPKAITAIHRILDGKNRDEFATDWTARPATERLLEIISVACSPVPNDVKSRETDIPWRRIADLGNILRPAYPDTNPEIVWSIAKNDLASLQAFAEKVIHEEG